MSMRCGAQACDSSAEMIFTFMSPPNCTLRLRAAPAHIARNQVHLANMGPRREVCDSHSVEPTGNRAFAAPPPLVAAANLELDSPAAERVGWGFIALYTLAFMS